MDQSNILTKAYRSLKNILVYRPPQNPSPFVLDETDAEKGIQSGPRPPVAELKDKTEEIETLLRYAKRLEQYMERVQLAIQQQDTAEIVRLAEKMEKFEHEQQEVSPLQLGYNIAIQTDQRLVSCSLEENKKIIESLYALPQNKDVMIRPFVIGGAAPVKAMLVFLDGMVDKQTVNLAVLRPLMLPVAGGQRLAGENLLQHIIEKVLPSGQAKAVDQFRDIADGINGGDTVLFIDGLNKAVIIETKGYAHRGVDRPQTEQSIRGSQSAFAEALRVNTGLIRTMMQTSDLVTEIVTVGDRIPVKCAIMYLKSVTNAKLVAEVRRRIKGVSTDYIVDMGVLEQFIEDHPSIPFPQMLSTERPDRVASSLAEGKLALVLDGTPFVHILPVTFFTFFHSAEDFSLKTPAGDFMRILRFLGTLLAVILPASYLAINYYHQEALPTELALAIAGARERVPFPALFEIVLMEFAFELIREAGIRVPGLLGSTIGIVGAIILGQAAVAANLVSPITVVIIAITGLASFSIPDYRMAFGLRMMRFIFLILAAAMGLVGVAIGLLIATVILCNMKSFGVPYMSPVGAKATIGFDVVRRGPVFRQERRPDYLNTQDEIRQPHISRRWIKQKPVGGEDEE